MKTSVPVVAQWANRYIVAFHITISCDVYLSGGGGSDGASCHCIGYIANTSVMDCVRVGIIYGTKPWNEMNKSILCALWKWYHFWNIFSFKWHWQM